MENLSSSKFFTYLLILIAIVIPGLGHIYLSQYELFLKLDVYKLLLLSIFYSSPLFIMGIFYLIIQDNSKTKNKEDYYRIMINNCSTFILVVYFLSLGWFYYTDELSNLMQKAYLVSLLLVGVRLIIKGAKSLWNRPKPQKKLKNSLSFSHSVNQRIEILKAWVDLTKTLTTIFLGSTITTIIGAWANYNSGNETAFNSLQIGAVFFFISFTLTLITYFILHLVLVHNLKKRN